MTGRLTDEQKVALTRAAVLRGRHGAVLAAFEADLVDSCILRFRDQGDRALLTDNEWRVVQEAVGGMEAVRDDEARNAGEAA